MYMFPPEVPRHDAKRSDRARAMSQRTAGYYIAL